MRKINPRDIPPKGRYDMVALKVGPNATKDMTVVALIDNGPFKGKRVSGTRALAKVGQRFSALVTPVYTAKDTGEEVDPSYADSNVVVRYSLSDFRTPHAPAQLKPTTAHARFVRSPRP